MSDGLERLRFEMSEQPELVRRLVSAPAPVLDEIAASVRDAPPRAIVLVARGSSDHAATYGRYLFEVRNGALTSLAAPSAFTVYERGPDLRDTLVIGISQSGRGEDVTAVVRAAREVGARTVAIVNDPASPLAEAAQWVLDCGAGPEESVPATKTVLAQMTLLALLSSRMELALRRRSLRSLRSVRAEADSESDQPHQDSLRSLRAEADSESDQPHQDSLRSVRAGSSIPPEGVDAFARLPDAIGGALSQEDSARALAQHLAHLDHVSVVGRGFAYPIALELALKLEEMAHIHASAWSAADFRHGPVTLVGPDHRVLVLDAGGRSTAQALETARAVSRRATEAYLLRAGRFENFRDAPALTLPCDVEEHLAPLVLLVLGQVLAREVAVARGLDPSNPPGLRKVTSTR